MKQCIIDCFKCKYKNICGGCSNCEALLCNKNCNHCEVVCFGKKNISKYLKNINLKNIYLKNNYYYKLPFNIPVIPARTKQRTAFDIIAVKASTLLSTNGEKINQRFIDKGIQKELNLSNNTKFILEFYIKDKQLEGFWDKRKFIYKDLKKLNFEYIISPNFSIYNDSTRLEHLYNIKRNITVYNDFLENGINSIPDICWFNKNDLDKWIEEINKNKIKIFSYSFQNVGINFKSSNDWKNNLLGLNYLSKKINHTVDIVIAGIVSPFRLIDIYNTIDKKIRLVILNQTAFIHSRKAYFSETQKTNYKLSFDDIFIANVNYYNKIYENIFKSNELSNIYLSSKSILINKYSEIKNSENNNLLINFTKQCLKRKRIYL